MARKRWKHSSHKYRAEYMAWANMHRRCYGGHPVDWQYRARGIAVCARWASFDAFMDDLGPRPTKGHTLERIDNEGDYAPENCRWATWGAQHNNKRGVVKVTLDGETLSLAQWARRIGMKPGTLRWRVSRARANGGSAEDAVRKAVEDAGGVL